MSTESHYHRVLRRAIALGVEPSEYFQYLRDLLISTKEFLNRVLPTLKHILEFANKDAQELGGCVPVAFATVFGVDTLSLSHPPRGVRSDLVAEAVLAQCRIAGLTVSTARTSHQFLALMDEQNTVGAILEQNSGLTSQGHVLAVRKLGGYGISPNESVPFTDWRQAGENEIVPAYAVVNPNWDPLVFYSNLVGLSRLLSITFGNQPGEGGAVVIQRQEPIPA